MATRAGVDDIERNDFARLDDDQKLYDSAQGLPESEPPLPHWSAHRRNCRLPGMYKYVPSQLHNQVMDLVEEYDASRPRIQFISQVEDFIESHAELKNTALPCDIVLARWAEQGLASYADADQWGHEEPKTTMHIPAPPMLSDVDADMSFLGNFGTPPTQPSEPNKSRPLHQFLAQVATESRILADQMRRDNLLRYYDSSGSESFDTTPLEITRPDIGTLAYRRVRKIWVKWQIWDRSWGLLPGLAWKHEQYLDDFVRERLGEELFSRLPSNYLQGKGSLRVPAYEYDDPGKQSSAAQHRILQPPIIFRALFLDGPGDRPRIDIPIPIAAAPIAPDADGVTAAPVAPDSLTGEPSAVVKAEEANEPSCEYLGSDSGNRGSGIENEDPGVDTEPTNGDMEPDAEMEEPVVQHKKSFAEDEALAVEQDGFGNMGVQLATKGKEPDFEMEEVRVEEGSVKSSSTSTRLHSTFMHAVPNEDPNYIPGSHPERRPRSRLSAILNDDSSDCPFRNPDDDSGSTMSNYPGTNRTRDTAHREHALPHGLPPSRWGNPYKVMKLAPSSARSISPATAERAVLLAIPRSDAAAEAVTAATEAWMDRHDTYSSRTAVKQEEGSGSAPAPSTTSQCHPEEGQASGSGSRSAHTDDHGKKEEQKESAEEQ